MTSFSLEELILESAEAVRPPERLTVSQAAERYRRVNNPGAYVGPWLNETTPYLVEPMDVLASLDHTGMCFVGPAQCGKTDMVLNWIGYSAICDPADMMVIQTAQNTARDFSMRRIDRLHRHSPEIGDRKVHSKYGDNTFDKHYKSGMMLTLAWPSINELSGRPIPRLWLTDYDRDGVFEDVDGEGSGFDLARKRATTFRSHGMCAAESSPGFPVDDPKWVRSSKHEAPPTGGILKIYNRGDRRRWHWQCVRCRNWFEPNFNLFVYPDCEDAIEAGEMATLRCPHCEIDYSHDPMDDLPGKHGLNKMGRWVPDNCYLDQDGVMHGTPPRSAIASFWLKGTAAAFSDWKTLVTNYIDAEREYEKTGSEEALKSTVNVDQGDAYIPKLLASMRVPEELKARAKGDFLRVVHTNVRFLIATVDVQKSRFVVQVHGIGANKDIHIVDRFDIRKSKRSDEDGDSIWVKPGSHPEDWRLLAEQVMGATYPLADGSGRHMGVKLTLCDSGGEAGVTSNAYDFYRWLRWGSEDDEQDRADGWTQGMAARFLLVKGAVSKSAPRVKISFPDSQRNDRHAGARGEIPVLFINSNSVKDMADNILERKDPGGRVVFPEGLSDNFYTELCVEVKDPAKGWLNPKRFRNESWDLLAYCVAATLTPAIALEHMEMNNPPGWAEEWDANDLVFLPEVEERPFDSKSKKTYDLASLAKNLA